MARQTTFQDLLGCLEDRSFYTLFLTGQGAYEGSFRVDRRRGSDVKHGHLLFDAYRTAEIYPEPPEADAGEMWADDAAIPHRIEHTIKERYRRLYGEEGLKARSFEVMRVTNDGRYAHEDMRGGDLSRELKSLIRQSRTLTVMEKGSRAEHLLRATLAGSGDVRLHEGELTFSDLSPDEKELYEIDESGRDKDVVDREDNGVAHHPE